MRKKLWNSITAPVQHVYVPKWNTYRYEYTSFSGVVFPNRVFPLCCRFVRVRGDSCNRVYFSLFKADRIHCWHWIHSTSLEKSLLVTRGYVFNLYARKRHCFSTARFPFVLILARFGRTIWRQNWTCRSSVIYWVSHYQLVPNKDVLWKVRKIRHSLSFWELSPLFNF